MCQINLDVQNRPKRAKTAEANQGVEKPPRTAQIRHTSRNQPNI